MPFDRDDLDFQLYDVLRLEDMLARHDDLDRAAIDGMIDMTSQLAAEKLEPFGDLFDSDEPRVENGVVVLPPALAAAHQAIIDSGVNGAVFEPEQGGMGLPETVHQALAFVLAAGDVSAAAYSMLSVGAGRLIQSFGSPEQKETYLRPIVEGRFTGTMCLSEPHAGSSLTDIATKATPLGNGQYAISGSKMWISGGDHDLSDNIIHMVLAKLPDAPAGVKGISLFIAPKRRVGADGAVGAHNNVSLVGLNHKMGYRGTTNCALNFGETGECVGELVGEPHQGLRYMFQMMNEARIGVGLGATALGQAGYQVSLTYARERVQGRHPDDKDPASPAEPIIEHADIRRLLLAQKASVEPALALGLYCARLADDLADPAQADTKQTKALLLDLLTPIAKSWPSEFCLEANKHAIQVLGGAGYTRDYPVERYYRANRLNPIHEGTHGIQGVDLLGRKVVAHDGAAFQALAAAMQTDIEHAGAQPLAGEFAPQLAAALDRTAMVTRALIGEMVNSPRRGLANATVYLDMTGHVVMAWMWLRLVAAADARMSAGGAITPFLEGKRQAARYFYAFELSRLEGWEAVLMRNDLAAFEMDAAWF